MSEAVISRFSRLIRWQTPLLRYKVLYGLNGIVGALWAGVFDLKEIGVWDPDDCPEPQF